TILGGQLEVVGSIVAKAGHDSFDGQINLGEFRLSESSSVSRALTLASFSGISDAIEGRGVAIRRAEVPVTATRDRITIREAKLRGSDVGVLVSGDVDRRAGTVDLAGEIAPA
ncbi:MAG: hypothetical protein VW644_02485, partial [Alphaproteobacteria bacterium]